MSKQSPDSSEYVQLSSFQLMIRWALAIAFVVLIARFWHPYYGFTSLIQLDGEDAKIMVPELRGGPIYAYQDTGGYDGAAYAQIATRPSASGTELNEALDSLPYRARRILLSWVAYAIGFGDAVRAVHVYATLNIVIWLGCAWLLHRMLPASNWKNLIAWIGVLFSAGALHSVRFALTDLAAMGLIAWAFCLEEKQKSNLAMGALSLVGLVRETAIIANGALWPGPFGKHRWNDFFRLSLSLLPLGCWLIYLRLNVGPVGHGMGNFTWPVIGLIEKLNAVWTDLFREPDRLLAIATALATVSLVAQLIYISKSWCWSSAWWRLGAVHAGLMLWLGQPVWEGHPGAATRVLLPLTLAFNVLAARKRAAWTWLVIGNLTILSGLIALARVPKDLREVASGQSAHGSYVVHINHDWYSAESNFRKTWAWTATRGEVKISLWPKITGVIPVQVSVRGITERSLKISQKGKVVWEGTIAPKDQWILIDQVSVESGTAVISFECHDQPISEGSGDWSRQLGFAISGFKIVN